MKIAGLWIYEITGIGTFIYLTWFEGYVYTSWNWMIALPVNIFLGQIWPVYWSLFHWL